MSHNESSSRKSKYSDKEYEKSSIYNKSVKSDINNLSIDLPKNERKHRTIERELIERQLRGNAPIINLVHTRYPVLLEMCGHEGLGWRVQNLTESKNWNIKWCDSGVTNEVLQKMNYHQKINHFPNISIIARKNTLAATLAKMKEKFALDYDFFPRTFLYPNDYAKIRHYYVESRKRELLKTFIVKPQAGCQGRGIYLTQNPGDFEKEERCVIQKYISNPLLYKGLKFDLRIYVLLASCSPLRIYVYNQGLVRFATEKYELPDSRNINNFYIHLTNYAINKSNPNYEYNYTVNDMSYGHKKSLAEFFKTLKEMGYKAHSYWSQIKDHIIKTLIAAQPFLIGNYKTCRPMEPTYNMCFELLGFDFLIDNQDKCSLLEVNHTPSFSTDTPLDHIVKKNLIKDTLLMINSSQQEMTVREKLQRISQREKLVKFKLDNDTSAQERQSLMMLLNEIRLKHELKYKGTYEMIYPCKNEGKMERYNQFMMCAGQLFQQSSSNSMPTIPSVWDIRHRLKQIPKVKLLEKQIIKENFSKNILESLGKRNIIYNYNYIKKEKEPTGKRTLVTLPSEPYKEIFSSNKIIQAVSKQKLRSESLNREKILREHKRDERYQMRSEQKRIDNELMGLKVDYGLIEQNESSSRSINSFSNRFRAYKTPLMF